MSIGIKEIVSLTDIQILIGHSIQGFIPNTWNDPESIIPITLTTNTVPYIYLNKGILGLGIGSPQYTLAQTFANPCTLAITNNGIRITGSIITMDNSINPLISENSDQFPLIIGSKNSSVADGIINTVIIGGNNIIASSNNSVYVPKISLGYLSLPPSDPCDYTYMLYNVGGILYWNGTTISGGGSGGSCILGPAPTGWDCDQALPVYGPDTGGVSGLAAGMVCSEAFDRLETTVSKLAPSKPPLLNTRTLLLESEYNARLISTNTALETAGSLIIATINTTPYVRMLKTDQITSSPALVGARDGNDGILSAQIYANGATVSSSLSISIDCTTKTVLPVTDSDANGLLSIIDIQDYYGTSGPPLSNWWYELSHIQLERTTAYTPSVERNEYQFTHTGDVTSSVNKLFHVDAIGTGSIVTNNTQYYPSGSNPVRILNGVPFLNNNDIILASYSVLGAVSYTYHATNFSRIYENGTAVAQSNILSGSTGIGSIGSNSYSSISPSLPYTYGNTIVVTEQELIVQDNIFKLGDYTYNGTISRCEFIVTSWKSNDSLPSIISSTITGTNIMIDSVSNTTDSVLRLYSGTGQYPSIFGVDWGTTWNDTVLLSTNKELQYMNGRYQYPELNNYTTRFPAGPNYSALTPDSYANMRWATFEICTLNANTGIYIRFNGTNGFSSIILSNWELYGRVVGSIPTVGWINGNSGYPGTGSPTNNGDAALVLIESTNTIKRFTFGTTARTGTFYIRLGIPSGNSKYFTGISYSFNNITYTNVII